MPPDPRIAKSFCARGAGFLAEAHNRCYPSDVGRIVSESESPGWADRLFNKPNRVGLLNRAVLWHLQLCLRLLDRLGYHATAANVSAAIDALTEEALSIDEISEMDLDREERVQLILDLFAKHENVTRPDDDGSTDAE